jgi:hypothetical protein
MHTPQNNNEVLREELDLVGEVRELERLTKMSRKQRVVQRYNTKFVKREFTTNNLVLRRASIGQKNAKDGKLTTNWEGPYWVVRSTRKGAYALETLQGRELPRTFNVFTGFLTNLNKQLSRFISEEGNRVFLQLWGSLS